MPAPDSIFISYRRIDSQDITGRIHEYLERHFGVESIFLDVHSIPLGNDYRDHLRNKAQTCKVMVVVLGPDWLSTEDKEGNRRLDDPDDWVRLEVRTALERNIKVIPLLIGKTRVPDETDLPDDMKPLAYKNGTPVRPEPDFRHDMKRLIQELEKTVGANNSAKPVGMQQVYLRRLEQLEVRLAAVMNDLDAALGSERELALTNRAEQLTSQIEEFRNKLDSM